MFVVRADYQKEKAYCDINLLCNKNLIGSIFGFVNLFDDRIFSPLALL